MVYRHPLDVPMRYQWDADSRLPRPDPGTAPGNCGVTCVAMIAQYYRDTWSGIYATRRLAVTNDAQMFTSINQQSLMLARRGVPNHASRPSVAAITSILSSGRRPILVGLNMSQVPPSIAGHPFRGNHAVLLRANAVQNGIPGKLAADPNFSPYTNRLDPTRGRRFYPDWVIQNSYYNAGMWALVPDRAKVVAPAPIPVPKRRIPVLKFAPEGWAVASNGARVLDGIGGPTLIRLNQGVQVTTIGETLDNQYRQVLFTAGGVNKFGLVKRDELLPLKPGGDPAFRQKVFDLLIAREA